MNLAQFCQETAQIQRMERGKLTLMRQGPNGPHYKLQAWENGKNASRHISQDQAGTVQEAIDGYRKFHDLAERYAQSIVDKTRAELAAQSKKKTYLRLRKSSWPKTRKSSR